MVQGVWFRAGLGVGRDWGMGGLWYGWVGCMGWGKRVGMRSGQGLGWGISEALKSHPSAAESWLRPLLDTMSCNRSSKVGWRFRKAW